MLVLPLESDRPSNENASLRSTIENSEAAKIGFRPSHNGRRVRFLCSRNKEYPNKKHSSADFSRSELWYQSKDYEMFKSVNSKSVKDIALMETSNFSPSSYGQVMGRLYLACKAAKSDSLTLEDLVCEEDRIQLCYWMDIATTRLGMESLVIEVIELDSLRRQGALYARARRIQEECEFCLDGNGEEELCRLSERLSKPSRLFSHAIAEASSSSFHSTIGTVEIWDESSKLTKPLSLVRSCTSSFL